MGIQLQSEREVRMTKVKAFTLVELLVVIAIIALLLSILLPSLSKARDLSKQLVCGTNSKQIYLACELYTGDNGGNYPQWYGYKDPHAGWSWSMFLTGFGGGTNYLTKKGQFDTRSNVLICPATKMRTVGQAGSVVNWSTYGVNSNRWNLVSMSGRASPTKWLNKNNIASSGNIVMIYCSGNGYGGGSPYDVWNDWDLLRVTNLHRGKYPILWFDGRVTSENKELMKTKANGGNPKLHW